MIHKIQGNTKRSNELSHINTRSKGGEMLKAVAIIPSRYGSTRLPGKPLVDICGKPLVRHVYERAQRARRVSEVIVATDDQRVLETVKGFGGKAVLTSSLHRTGTDRVAEVARNMDADIVVNVQGDEPLIEPEMIDQAIEPLIKDPQVPMATLATRIGSSEELSDPNVVKVVVDQKGFALYFSRSQIPFVRNHSSLSFECCFLKHIGLYVYRLAFLRRFASMPQGPLERSEELEQLRALENGFRIAVVVTRFNSIGVDIPEDLERVRRIFERGCPE